MKKTAMLLLTVVTVAALSRKMGASPHLHKEKRNCESNADFITLTSFEKSLRKGSLSACWLMDEGSGPAIGDGSGNMNDGQVIGCSWVAGNRGSALWFDGTGSYISSPALGTPTELTITAWVYPESSSEWQCLLERGSYSSPPAPVLNTSPGGMLLPGQYEYAFVEVDSSGREGALSPREVISLSAPRKVNVSLPTAGIYVNARKLYRTDVNDPGGKLKYIGEEPGNGSAVFEDDGLSGGNSYSIPRYDLYLAGGDKIYTNIGGEDFTSEMNIPYSPEAFPSAYGMVYDGWTSAGEALAEDGSEAIAVNDAQDYHHYGFSLPVGAVIDGIEVMVKARKSNAVADDMYLDVALSWDGGISLSQEQTILVDAYPSFQWYAAGGSNDTWGRQWSAAELGDTAFLTYFYADTLGDWLEIDAVKIRVYYSYGGTLTLDMWNFITVTWDRTMVKHFVNGAFVDGVSLTNCYTGTNDTLLGLSAIAGFLTRGYEGIMDEIKLYPIALTAEQIAAEYGRTDASCVQAGDTFESPIDIIPDYTGEHDSGEFVNDYEDYSCGTLSETGPDVVYRLAVPSDGALEILLTNLSEDLDLFLCDGPAVTRCSSESVNAGAGDESINEMVAVGTYYVVVDGANGASGSYTIDILFTVSTPTATPTGTPSATTTATSTPTVTPTCDGFAPRINRGPRITYISDTIAVVEWITDESAGSMVEYGPESLPGYQDTVIESGFVREHVVLISQLTPDIVYDYRVSSSDSCGSGPTYRQGQFRTQSAPPSECHIINGPLPRHVSDRGAVIFWNTAHATTGEVGYRPQGTGQYAWILQGIYRTTHVTILKNLQPDTEYRYMVCGEDPDGNRCCSDEFSFRTDNLPDSHEPLPEVTPYYAGGDSNYAHISWETDEWSSSEAEYQSAKSYAVSGIYGNGYHHDMILPNLRANSLYSYYVVSDDLSGNRYRSGWKSFQSGTARDTDPPLLTSAPRVDYVTDERAIITWETDETGYGEIELIAAPKIESAIIWFSNSITTRHKVYVTGVGSYSLRNGLSYVARVTDLSGNVAEWGPYQLSAGQVDLNVPVFIQGVDVGVFPGRIALSWETNEYADSVVWYGTTPAMRKIKGFVDDDASHEVTLTRLIPGIIYYCKACSTDPSGNGPSCVEVTFIPLPSLTPTPTMTPTATPAFTLTPTPNPLFTSRPNVRAAGYFEVPTTGGGALSMIALVHDEDGLTDVREVGLSYQGKPMGIELADDGVSGDFNAGDGYYGITLDLQAPLMAFSGIVEIVVNDRENHTSLMWPYLIIEGGNTRMQSCKAPRVVKAGSVAHALLETALPVNEILSMAAVDYHSFCEMAESCERAAAQKEEQGEIMRPSIPLAGYWDTAITTTDGGAFTLLAYVHHPRGVRYVANVEIYYDGNPSGIYLNDRGLNGDMYQGDGVYTLALTLSPMSDDRAGKYLYELVATDRVGNKSVPWPYLVVEESGGKKANSLQEDHPGIEETGLRSMEVTATPLPVKVIELPEVAQLPKGLHLRVRKGTEEGMGRMAGGVMPFLHEGERLSLEWNINPGLSEEMIDVIAGLIMPGGKIMAFDAEFKGLSEFETVERTERIARNILCANQAAGTIDFVIGRGTPRGTYAVIAEVLKVDGNEILQLVRSNPFRVE